MFKSIKQWWIEFIYGSKEEQERLALMDKEYPGWREEAEQEREAAKMNHTLHVVCVVKTHKNIY